MVNLSIFKKKINLRYLELRQINFTQVIFKIYYKLFTYFNIFFLNLFIERTFCKKNKFLKIVEGNFFNDQNNNYLIRKPKNSCEIICNANKYINNKFFNNNQFTLINEKKIKYNLTGKGFKCPLIHDFSTNTNLRPLWDKVRSYHFVTLYLAFLITKNKKYYKNLEFQINFLLKKNRYLKNYFWGDALNLSIRSLNILSLLQIIKRQDKILREKLIGLYIITCEAIAITRSRNSSIINNHHFCETLALTIYYELVDNNKILDSEIKNFKKCYETIFYNNGCNYEGSLPYQRFLLEFSLVTQYFHLNISKNNTFSPILQKVIEKIWIYSINITGKNGEFKHFGDLDHGQVIKIKVKNSFNINDIKSLYKYTQLKYFTFSPILDLYNRSPSKATFTNISEKFIAEPGYSRVRLDKNLEIWIDTDYPGLGKNGIGGHGHNDVTSIILNSHGRELICDYGVSSYFISSEKRNFERSSFNHNVVNRYGFEQNELLSKYIINPNINSLKVLDKSSRLLIHLKIIYNINYKDGVKLDCRRNIIYKNKILRIKDIIYSKDYVNLQQNWNLNQNKLVKIDKKNIYYKNCKLSFSSQVSNKNTCFQSLTHYENAKNQFKIVIPLKCLKTKNNFKYQAELKLNMI